VGEHLWECELCKCTCAMSNPETWKNETKNSKRAGRWRVLRIRQRLCNIKIIVLYHLYVCAFILRLSLVYRCPKTYQLHHVDVVERKSKPMASTLSSLSGCISQCILTTTDALRKRFQTNCKLSVKTSFCSLTPTMSARIVGYATSPLLPKHSFHDGGLPYTCEGKCE
jgi:hypothetical protein